MTRVVFARAAAAGTASTAVAATQETGDEKKKYLHFHVASPSRQARPSQNRDGRSTESILLARLPSLMIIDVLVAARFLSLENGRPPNTCRR
jgi:hypothetical protein